MAKGKKIFEDKKVELKADGDSDSSASPAAPAAAATAPKAQPGGNAEAGIQINAQYIKDLSFENPHNPLALMQVKAAPKVDVGVDVKAQSLGDSRFEVELRFSAKASAEEKALYLVELNYAGIFTLKNIPQEQLEPALLVYCPSMLFPFARRIIADATRDGILQPLWLDPVDFGRLYANRKKQS